MKCVTSAADAGWEQGGVKDGLQSLVLEIDTCNTPKGGIWFKVELKSVMEMREIEEGMERVTAMIFKGSFMEMVGSNGNIDR